MRPYDREKNNVKMRKYRELHRQEYNEYQKLYKRKIRGSRLATKGVKSGKRGAK